jgi:DNA replication protein DnaC
VKIIFSESKENSTVSSFFLLNMRKNSWNSDRKFKFCTVQKYVVLPTVDDEFVSTSRCIREFSPLSEIKKFLLENGFYEKYIYFKMNWKQSEFHKNLFNDFFEKYVIAGEKPHGYYFYGNIGIGKTTLLTSIAKVLSFFLSIKVKYISMTRLVRLITSISESDKQKLFDLENCDILFIDDLGIEKYTTDNQESLVRDFFAYRYGNLRLNIIAGNSDIRTLQKKNSFNRQMADYLNEKSHYKIVKMTGASKRL